MARRPDFTDKPLDVEDLIRLRQRLDQMSITNCAGSTSIDCENAS